jgi:hypothetical protein
VFVCVGNAVNAVLLNLLAFMKLQSTMDVHKQAVEMYDSLFTEFEFEQELRFLNPIANEAITVVLAQKLEAARDNIQKNKADLSSSSYVGDLEYDPKRSRKNI